MRAMVLKVLGPVRDDSAPLERCDWPDPSPGAGEILIRVGVCGVCHTELDEIEGRTPPPRLPVILGHQVVGRVARAGGGTSTFRTGDRVGVAWIFSADETTDIGRKEGRPARQHDNRWAASASSSVRQHDAPNMMSAAAPGRWAA